MTDRLVLKIGSYTSEIITDSLSITEVFHNNLGWAENSCSLSIPFNQEIQDYINTHIDNGITATVFNSDRTENVFAGCLRKNFSFGKAQHNDNIKIELLSLAELLNKNAEEPMFLVNQRLDTICTQLIGLCTTIFTIPQIAEVVPVFTLEEGQNIREVMTNLLREYGYTWDTYMDCDSQAEISIKSLFQITDKQYITNTFDGSNCLEKITVNKTEQVYDGVNLTWNQVKFVGSGLIFADTTGADSSSSTYSCKIDIPAGGYLGEFDDDEKSTASYFITYDSSEGEVVYAYNTNITLQSTYNGGLDWSFTNLGTKGKLSVHNVSNIPITITKLQVTGDAYVKPSTDIIKTSGNKRTDLNSSYLQDYEKANHYAKNYASWLNYADYTVSLKSMTDYPYGTFVKITESGLGTIYGRITKKITKLNKPYEYTIEAISEYEPVTITAIEKIKESANVSIGTYGISGEGGGPVYLGMYDSVPECNTENSWYLNKSDGYVYGFSNGTWTKITDTNDYRLNQCLADQMQLKSQGKTNTTIETVINNHDNSLLSGDTFTNKLGTKEILINQDGVIKSENYEAGESGFCIKANGEAEFSTGRFRGGLGANYEVCSTDGYREDLVTMEGLVPGLTARCRVVFTEHISTPLTTTDNLLADILFTSFSGRGQTGSHFSGTIYNDNFEIQNEHTTLDTSTTWFRPKVIYKTSKAGGRRTIVSCNVETL